MDEQKLPPLPAQSDSLDAPDSLDATSIDNMRVSDISSSQSVYPIESIEVKDAPAQTSPNLAPHQFYSPGFSKRRALIISACITLVVTLVTGTSILTLSRNVPSRSRTSNGVKSEDVSLKNASVLTLPEILQTEEESLLVNGDLITTGEIKLSNRGFVTILRAPSASTNQTFTLPNGSGTLCLDNNNCSFAPQAGLAQTNNAVAALRAQLGQLTSPTIPAASLVNNQAGVVTVQGTSNQVNVSTASGTITLSLPQSIGTNSTPTFGGLTLVGNMVLPLDCSPLLNGGALTTNASGQIVCSADDGGAGSGNVSTTTGGTAGVIPVFTTLQNIEDSLLSQALGTITVSGALTANSLTLSSALTVANGGTGATSFTANGVLYGNGAGSLLTTLAPSAGQLLLGNSSGVPTFTSVTGDIAITGAGLTTIQNNSVALGVDTTGNYVDTISAGNGISVGGGSGEGVTNTLSVVYGSAANTSVQGNTSVTITAGTNVTGGGAITLGAGGSVTLNVTDNPVFAGTLTVQGASATIGGVSQQGSLILNDGTSNTGTLQTGPLGQNTAYVLPDPGLPSVNICVSSGNCAGAGSGVTTPGGTTNRLAAFSGSQTLMDSWLLQNGSTLELNSTRNLSLLGGNLTVTGSGSFTTTLSVGGALTAASFNALALQANATGFQISGGSVTKTLTIADNAILNQNLRTTDTPTFAGLTLTAPLTLGNGGTGQTGTPTNGQLLIGNGTGFNLANITNTGNDGTVVITNTAGGISLSAPNAGSCAGCANTALSNLSSVSINTSLLAQPGVDLGSTGAAFRDLYLRGGGAGNMRITGSPTGNKTLTLDNLNGTAALVQTAGSSSAQTGDIHATGALIAGTALQAPLVKTADNSTTANLTIRSGNAGVTTSGNVTITSGNANTDAGNVVIDSGTGGSSAGDIIIGATNASSVVLGRTSQTLIIDADTITATGATFNGQTISSVASFTGTLAVEGNTLSLGEASTTVGGIDFYNSTNGNSFRLQSGTTGGNLTFTLPTADGSLGDCIKTDGSGGLSFGACAAGSGISGSGTAGRIAKFTGTGNAVGDSILNEVGTALNLLGTLSVGVNGASGTTGAISFLDGSNPGRAVSVTAQQAGGSYTLQLPTDADATGACLTLVNVGAGLNRIQAGSCAAGGTGGNVNATGGAATVGKTLRVTAYDVGGLGNYDVAASLVQDNGSTVGINTTPQGGNLLTVGSSNAFAVSDTGAVTASASITSSGLIQTSANNQALTLSGAPTNNATQSLLRLGSAIAGGNVTANGGTYIGLNAPNSGAGSAADFLHLQKNGTTELLITNTGDVTAGRLNGLLLAQGASQFTLNGGTGTARTLTVSGDSTINQDLSTSSNTVAFGRINSLTTKLETSQGGTGANLSGSLAGAVAIFNATTDRFEAHRITSNDGSIDISNSDGNINIQVDSCSTCADTSLSNLTSVSINSSLLAQSGVDLGSASAGFRDLYLYGSGTQGSHSFRITGTPTGNRTITIPDATDTVCLQSLANCGGGGSTVTGTGTNGRIARFSGTNTVTDSILTESGGNLVTVAGSLTVNTNATVTGTLSSGAINGLTLQSNATGFQISGGTGSRTLVISENVTLNQNLRTTDSPLFGGLTLGNDSGSPVAGQLILHDGGASNASTGTLITATSLTQSTTYTLPDPGNATATVCLLYGSNQSNCAGAGGGITGSGSSGTFAVFNGTNSIANSSVLSESGGVLTVSGTNISFSNSGARTVGILQSSSGAGQNLTLVAGQGATGTNNGGNLLLQGGARGNGSSTDGSVIIRPQNDNTAVFMVQNAANTQTLLTISTSSTGALTVNTNTSVSTGRTLTVTDLVGLTIGNGGNTVSTSTGALRYAGTARNDRLIALKPEFEGAILRPDGSSNVGYMISELCSDALNINDGGGTAACDTGQAHSYYEWTTVETGSNDYDVYVRWKLPSDFDTSSGTGFDDNITINVYGWRTNSSDSLVANLYNDEGGVCGTADQAVASVDTDWSNLTFAGIAGDTDCEGTDDASDIRAGEYVTFRFRMTADNAEIVRLGEIEISYKSIF